MPEEPQNLVNLVYLQEFNAIICTHCKIAVSFKYCSRHLYRKHADLPLAERKRVLSTVPEEAGQALGPQDIRYPSDVPLELDVLKPAQARFVCQSCFSNSSRKADIKHLADCANHNRARTELMQTFFQENHQKRYFEVRRVVADPMMVATTPLVDEFQRFQQEKQGRNLEGAVYPANFNSQINAWQLETGWREFMQVSGISMKDMAIAGAILDEDSPFLSKVVQVCKKYVQICFTCAFAASDFERRLLRNFDGCESSQLTAKPLHKPQLQATIDQYQMFWIRFVLFLVRIWKFGALGFEENNPGGIFSNLFSEAQRMCLRHFVNCIASMDDLDSPVTDDSINACRDLSMSFVCQNFYGAGSHHESALLLFLMSASILPNEYVWMQPRRTTSTIAAIVFCIQCCVFESCQFETRSEPQMLLNALKQACSQFISNKQNTPVCRLLRIWAKGASISKAMPGESVVSWNAQRDCLTIEAQRFSIIELQVFMRQLVEEAETILCCELLLFSNVFGQRVADYPAIEQSLVELISPQRIDDFRDNISDMRRSYNYISEARNDLQELSRANVMKLVSLEQFRTEWLVSDNCFKKSKVVRYMEARAKFLDLLIVLFLMLGGYPPRASEVSSVLWQSTDVFRELFAFEGQAMYVCNYNKTLSATLRQKVIFHFLPARVLRIVTLYLAAVVPFVEFLVDKNMDVTVRNRFSASDFAVFVKNSGKGYTRDDVSRIVSQTSQRILGKPINVHLWRHVAKAIFREKLSLQSSHVKRMLALLEPSEDNGEVFLQDQDIASNIQHGHEVQTAQMHYGRQSEIGRAFNWETIKLFQASSLEWHKFWQLEKDLNCSGISTVQNAIARTESNDGNAITIELLLNSLKKIYGPLADFRSEFQKQALEDIYCQRFKQVVAILPTGGGKSAVFWMSAILEMREPLSERRITVVVVPLIGLLQAAAIKAESLGIPSQIWDSERFLGNDMQPTRMVLQSLLLFVSADKVSSPVFLSELGVIQQWGYRYHAQHVPVIRRHLVVRRHGFV